MTAVTFVVTELVGAARQLLRHPAHTVGVTFLLTVALALAGVMFRACNGYLLRPLPAPAPTDPSALVLTVFACAALAALVPALRALRVDPAQALRTE